MTDDIRDENPINIELLLFSTIAVVIAVDLGMDWVEGAGIHHLVVELTVVLLASIGAGRLIRRITSLRNETIGLQIEVEASRKAADAWQQRARDYLRGLSEEIDDQFDRWELTEAEREVALLLLKGLSMKEIAAVRDVSPRTVRQQAHVVYKKGGLAGRADLSAFFLEDLLLPTHDAAGA